MEAERRALAGLWSVPGIGPMAVARVKQRLGLSGLVDLLIGEWVELGDLPTYARERIPTSQTLGQLGDAVFERAHAAQMKIAWFDTPEYPARLAEIFDAPPLLFYWGPGTDCPPRRRAAMVGTRFPSTMGLTQLRAFVQDVAAEGIGVVSGAAQGIDMLAHRQAVKVKGGETWAFVGAALDQLDRPQAELWQELRDYGATFWSELPPGVRADRSKFPRRNRLISGAADAVVALRAGMRSGTRYTIDYGAEQGRAVCAVPGPLGAHDSELCNHILAHGGYALRHAHDLLRVLGLSGYESHKPAPVSTPRVAIETLSAEAQQVFKAIDRAGKCFDDLVVELEMRSGKLIAALFELTMSGLVLEHAGRRYEKVE